MLRVVACVSVAALVCSFSPAARGQGSDEVERLRRENELLKKEVEVLKKEVELLKKEANAKPGSPAAGAKALADDDTEYELLRCVRLGTTKKVTFTFSAVNHVKDTLLGGAVGADKIRLAFPRSWLMSLTARDGETLQARVVFDPGQPVVRLTKGVAEKFQITVEGVDQDIAVFDSVILSYATGGLSNSEPVKFRNIKVEQGKPK